MLPSYSIPVQTRLFSVYFLQKSTPLWSQQISFLSDHEQERIKLEATREARMLQGPIRGRKISAVEGLE